MSRTVLAILKAGADASVQDRGRFGFRRYGVPVGGPVDWAAHATALALAGCAPGDPALECGPGGLVVEAREAGISLAVAGTGSVALWHRASGVRTALPAPFSLVLAAGERLVVRPGPGATWSVLAARGLDAGPLVLGSRATSAKAGLGPPPPMAGTLYPCEAAEPGAPPSLFADPLETGRSPREPLTIRLLAGPQQHLFGPEALATLFGEPFLVTPRRDRMGMRLEGPALRATNGHDIVSDGTVEGAVQVPGDGQPIVLCADRAPTGGYPKIAIVARADLPRLVQARPGTPVRFEAVSVDEAVAASTALRARLTALAPRTRSPSPDLLAATLRWPDPP